MFDHIPLIDRRVAVRDSIAKHGIEHFNMNDWFIILGDINVEGNPTSYNFSAVRDGAFSINDCGSAACIGGHCAVVAHCLGEFISEANDACEWLGIASVSSYLGRSGQHPFMPGYWQRKGCDSPEKIYDGVINYLDELVLEAANDRTTSE